MCRPSQTPHLTASSTWIRAAGAGGRWLPRWSPAPPARAGPPPLAGGRRAGAGGGRGAGGRPVPCACARSRQNVGPEGAPLPPDRMSEITSGVVVFQGPTASDAASHLFYASRVISRSRTRVKLNHLPRPPRGGRVCTGPLRGGHSSRRRRSRPGLAVQALIPAARSLEGLVCTLRGAGGPPDTLARVTTASPPSRRGRSPRDRLGGGSEGSPVRGCLARRMLAPGGVLLD